VEYVGAESFRAADLLQFPYESMDRTGRQIQDEKQGGKEEEEGREETIEAGLEDEFRQELGIVALIIGLVQTLGDESRQNSAHGEVEQKADR